MCAGIAATERTAAKRVAAVKRTIAPVMPAVSVTAAQRAAATRIAAASYTANGDSADPQLAMAAAEHVAATKRAISSKLNDVAQDLGVQDQISATMIADLHACVTYLNAMAAGASAAPSHTM